VDSWALWYSWMDFSNTTPVGMAKETLALNFSERKYSPEPSRRAALLQILLYNRGNIESDCNWNWRDAELGNPYIASAMCENQIRFKTVQHVYKLKHLRCRYVHFKIRIVSNQLCIERIAEFIVMMSAYTNDFCASSLTASAVTGTRIFSLR